MSVRLTSRVSALPQPLSAGPARTASRQAVTPEPRFGFDGEFYGKMIEGFGQELKRFAIAAALGLFGLGAGTAVYMGKNAENRRECQEQKARMEAENPDRQFSCNWRGKLIVEK